MKIMYINPYAGGPGVGRYWRSYHLSNAWRAEGHDVTIVTPAFHHLMDKVDRPVSQEVIDGNRYVFLPSLKYKDNGIRRFLSMILFPFSLFLYFLTQAFKPKPDLIIYSSAHPFGYPMAWLAARLFRARIYFEVRDIWPLSLVEVAGFSKRHPVVRVLAVLERFAYATADKVISLLPGAGSHMKSKGMARGKFLYVPNGFSKAAPPVASNILRSPLIDALEEYRRNGDFIFLYAGALGEPNAMHRFVDSLKFLSAERCRYVKFVIVGKGEQAADLQQRCIEARYDFVKFFPQQDKSVIHAALDRVDAGFFVMHDLPIYRFGVSLNKLYDYMAASLPVVAGFHAFNDPVTDSACGIRVAPDDPEALAAAFETVASLQHDDLKRMGDAGRAYLERNFEYSVLAEKLIG